MSKTLYARAFLFQGHDMAATLSASIACTFSWTYANALSGSITPTVSSSMTYSQSLTNGTGSAGTADLIYAVQSTISASGSTTIDLRGGSTDWFGTTITMVRLKYWLIKHTNDTTATSITVGNSTNPISFFSAATTTQSVRNNGYMSGGCSDATGVAMAAGSTDELKIVNADGSNTATYAVCLIGSSA